VNTPRAIRRQAGGGTEAFVRILRDGAGERDDSKLSEQMMLFREPSGIARGALDFLVRQLDRSLCDGSDLFAVERDFAPTAQPEKK